MLWMQRQKGGEEIEGGSDEGSECDREGELQGWREGGMDGWREEGWERMESRREEGSDRRSEGGMEGVCAFMCCVLKIICTEFYFSKMSGLFDRIFQQFCSIRRKFRNRPMELMSTGRDVISTTSTWFENHQHATYHCNPPLSDQQI